MALKYLTQERTPAKAEVIGPPTPYSPMQTKPRKTPKRCLIFCLLLLANIIVLNAAYGLYTAEEGTHVLTAIATDNLIYKLWKKYPLIPRTLQKGVVTGILFCEEKPAALIDNELVHEGDIIGGVKVIRIGPKKVQFEKNGKVWTQSSRGKPNAAWQ